MKKNITVLILLCALIFCLTACGEEEQKDDVSYVDTVNAYTEQPLTEAQQTAYRLATLNRYYTSGEYKVFRVTAKLGFNGEVVVIILLHGTTVEKIAGVDIRESADYGAKCFRDSYLSKFYGLDLMDYESLRGKDRPNDEGEIVYVTGATVTSKAVIASVNAVALFLHTNS